MQGNWKFLVNIERTCVQEYLESKNTPTTKERIKYCLTKVDPNVIQEMVGHLKSLIDRVRRNKGISIDIKIKF